MIFYHLNFIVHWSSCLIIYTIDSWICGKCLWIKSNVEAVDNIFTHSCHLSFLSFVWQLIPYQANIYNGIQCTWIASKTVFVDDFVQVKSWKHTSLIVYLNLGLECKIHYNYLEHRFYQMSHFLYLPIFYFFEISQLLPNLQDSFIWLNMSTYMLFWLNYGINYSNLKFVWACASDHHVIS